MITCPHCGKEFDEKAMPLPKRKWYHSNKSVVFMFLLIGPFALPLVWYNPDYKPLTKWIVTISVLGVTLLFIVLFVVLIKIVIEQFRALMQMK